MGSNVVKDREVPVGIIPHKLLIDNRVSLKAKALFAFISTKEIITVKSIENECLDGIDAINSGLKELESFGYKSGTKFRKSKGVTMIYSLYNDPFTAIVLSEF